MFKKALLLGIVSGLLAGVAAIIYARVYYTANEADFSKVVSAVPIIASSLFGGVLAAIGYKAYETAPIKLQAHPDKSESLSFRNIWVREVKRWDAGPRN